MLGSETNQANPRTIWGKLRLAPRGTPGGRGVRRELQRSRKKEEPKRSQEKGNSIAIPGISLDEQKRKGKLVKKKTTKGGKEKETFRPGCSSSR